MFVEKCRTVKLAATIVATMLSGMVATMAAPGPNQPPAGRAGVVRNFGKLPLRFEANRGQTDGQVKFLARGPGYGLFLAGQDAVLSLRKPGTAGRKPKTDVVRMQLVGADSRAVPEGVDLLPGIANYLVGEDRSQWHINVPSYSKVRYAGVYPGVDLEYYGNQQQLEYDFVVAAGADPGPIRLHFAGARRLELDGAGDLRVVSEDGSIAFHKPVVYQMDGGRRRDVTGNFTLAADNSIGFALGGYDHSRALVIDPTLIYSTFMGTGITALAVDSTGAAYVTGTVSTGYPTTPGAFEATDSDGAGIAFITKLNSSGTALVYSTFIGGSGSPYGGDFGTSIAVDSSGEAYIAGYTYSTDFPVTKGAFQTTNTANAQAGHTSFVTKLNATGTALVYSTFLGGKLSDAANALVLDSSGDAYVAGYTYSSNFPTTPGVFQSTDKSAADNGWNEYVAKLNPTGTGLIYATCIGGTGDYGTPQGIRLAVDGSGDAFVTATVLSTDFPVTAGVFQKASNAKAGYSNMTLSKLNPTATNLLYATYLGGSSSSYGDDVANGLAVDSAGDAYLAGTTYEANYPITKGAYETTNKTGGVDLATGFITKVNPTGTALVYSTYLGGSGATYGDYLWALALDSSGDVYVTGSTGSTDYPVTSNAYQSTNPASFNYGEVALLTEMNPAGNSLLYSTYFGGVNSNQDVGYGIALGNSGAVYLAGQASARDFPTTGGTYGTNLPASEAAAFAAEFNLGSAPATLATSVLLTSVANPAVTGSNVTFSASVYPNTGSAIPTGNVIYNIDQKDVATVAVNSKGFADYSTTTPLAPGQHAILASYQGNSTYSASGGNITQSMVSATPIISPAGGIYSSAQLVTMADATAGVKIYYTTDGTTPTASSTLYAAPLLVSAAEYIQAVAVIGSSPNSAIASASYSFINAPTVLAVPASAITTTGATLNALVSTNRMSGTYFFQYGTSSTALTLSTPKVTLSQPAGGGRIGFPVPVPVSTTVTSLASKTTYYYQIVIATLAGTSSGTVLSFTTN